MWGYIENSALYNPKSLEQLLLAPDLYFQLQDWEINAYCLNRPVYGFLL